MDERNVEREDERERYDIHRRTTSKQAVISKSAGKTSEDILEAKWSKNQA